MKFIIAVYLESLPFSPRNPPFDGRKQDTLFSLIEEALAPFNQESGSVDDIHLDYIVGVQDVKMLRTMQGFQLGPEHENPAAFRDALVVDDRIIDLTGRDSWKTAGVDLQYLFDFEQGFGKIKVASYLESLGKETGFVVDVNCHI